MASVRTATVPITTGLTDLVADIFSGEDLLLETVVCAEIGATGVYRADTTYAESDMWARVYSLSNNKFHSIERIAPTVSGVALQSSEIHAATAGDLHIADGVMTLISNGTTIQYNLLRSDGSPALSPAQATARERV